MSAAVIPEVPAVQAPVEARTTGALSVVGMVLAFTALAVLFRLYHLDFQSLFRDEGQTLSHVGLSWSRLMETATEDGHPVLYWIFLKLWTQLFGASVWSLRLPSALFGAVGCGLVAGLACRFGGLRAAGIAGTLAVFSTHLISSGQEARPYAFFGMLAVAWLWALLETGDGKRRWSHVMVALSTALLLYTDYFALPLIALGFVFGPGIARRATLGGLILWIPGAYQMVLFARGMNKLGYREMIGPLSASQTVSLILDLPTAIATGETGSSLIRLGMMVAVVVALALLVFKASREIRIGALCLGLATAAAILLIWKNGVPSSAASRAAMLTPLFILVVALAAGQAPVRLALPAAAMVLLVGGLDLGRGYYSRPMRGGWKQLAEWLRETGEHRPIYALEFQAPMLRYYHPSAQTWTGSRNVKGPYLFASDNPGATGEFSGAASIPPRRFVNVFLFELVGEGGDSLHRAQAGSSFLR